MQLRDGWLVGGGKTVVVTGGGSGVVPLQYKAISCSKSRFDIPPFSGCPNSSGPSAPSASSMVFKPRRLAKSSDW